MSTKQTTEVMITELADPHNNAKARFVELFSPTGGDLGGYVVDLDPLSRKSGVQDGRHNSTGDHSGRQ